MARILILAPDLSSNAAYSPWQFAGALSRAHDVTLVGPGTDAPWRPLAGDLAAVPRLPGWNPFSRATQRALLEAAQGADVLYAFKALPPSYGLALWARARTGIPVALHLDDWDGGWFIGTARVRRAWYALRGLGGPRNELYIRLLERLVPRADVLTVSSRALQRRFGGEVVRQGVDTDRVSPAAFPRGEARRRVGLEGGVGGEPAVILFLGTPQVHKGVGDLLEAYLRLDRPAARLWIVGAPRERGVEQELLRSRARGVELWPDVTFAEAAWHLSAADVFVVPQRGTPYAEHQVPAKLLHAMALGAAIVSSRVGDAEEILGGDPPAGVLVPPGDPPVLAAALARLLDEPARREALGREARRRAEELYGWRAMERQLRALLGGVLARRTG